MKNTHAFSLLLVAGSAFSQTTLKPVDVTGQQSPPAADVTGFGDVPLKDLPVSATVINHRQIEAAGARRLADLTRFDPSTNDAYDAPGYWDFVSIRGFTIDNRFNYRREGLPINAETAIPLDNKERVELLKGTSGIQAGTSAPGGLVNYVVKRPTDTPLREVRVEWTQRSSVLAAADLGGRFGNDNAFGYRLTAAQETLRPLVHDLDGDRSLLALAGDWRISPDSLLEGEVEWSRKKQASQAGFSLLGGVLPAVPGPRLNLNDQPWTPASRFDALTGTLRFTQTLARDWKVVAQLGTQRLKSDDYTAFPFGCSAEGVFDRYCSDGTFDYYDYRSIGEKRRQNAAQIELKGHAATGPVRHELSFGILRSTVHNTLPDYAYNWVGTGNVDGSVILPAGDPTLISGTGAQVDERSLELSVRDAMRWSERLTTWLGLRHTHLDRGYTQSVSTPWAAVSYKVDPSVTAYASWGQGVESKAVPNNAAVYDNAGAVLPALKSRQWELGAKGVHSSLSWQVAWFDIHRPVTNLDYCSINFLAHCVGQFDGDQVHRGLEAAVQWSGGPWRLGASAMLLRARREGSAADPASNGLRPINVPQRIVRAFAAWKVPGVAGLEVQGSLSHEGDRAVLADNSIMLPAWTRLDAALRYDTQVGRYATSWTLGLDNVTDRRYWRESPYQFGHVYLYPGAPRTVRMGVTFTL